MEWFFIILLGTVQGLTEFLPVSSTGHLILLEKVFNLSPDRFGLSFDVALHLGTLLALLFYFRKKLINITKKTVLLLLIGTLPALIIGFLLEDLIRDQFRNPFVVAIGLISFSFFFLYAERKSEKDRQIKDISLLDSIIIGFFQAVALIPGVSRSGITISGGLLRNLNQHSSGEFTFLLSIPIIILASGKDMLTLSSIGFSQGMLLSFILGAFVSFIVGISSIYYFLSYLKRHGLLPFIIYRIILGLFILLFFYG